MPPLEPTDPVAVDGGTAEGDGVAAIIDSAEEDAEGTPIDEGMAEPGEEETDEPEARRGKGSKGGKGAAPGTGAGPDRPVREPSTQKPSPPATSEPKPAKKPIPAAPPGITQVNATTWRVSRNLFDLWQADPYKLGNVRESGEGWQLIGIRQRSAYHLGMRNSDIVLEVNGHKLNTMPQLLAAYLACKNDTKFDVVFLRGGKRMTHHYTIID